MTRRSVILVVDDEPKNVRLLNAILTSQGYDVVTAEGGQQCLDRVGAQGVDLILLDVMMPGLGGFEITRSLRADPHHRLIPIILLTALDAAEERVRGIEAGCDDFISKPFDRNELLARIRTLLTLSYYRQQVDEKEKLEGAIKAARDGIVICSADWRVVKFNPAAKRYLALEDGVDESLLDVFRRHYQPSVPIPALVDIEHAPTEFELKREESEHFRALHLRVSLTVIYDPSGRASSLVACIYDVTDLVRDLRLKQEFLSLISHKMRSPLTPIMLYLSMLKEGLLSGDQVIEAVNQLSENFKRIHALVERLIEFVAAVQTSQDRGRTRVLVRERLEDVVDRFGRDASQPVRVVLQPGAANPAVDVHPSLFDLVFSNLLDNGIKFNESTEPRVTLSIATEGDWALISVKDNGRGIPPEQRERIFDEFNQLEREFTGSVPGAGLGLAIVQRVVTSYGGTVGVESEIGGGSELTVSLPTSRHSQINSAPHKDHPRAAIATEASVNPQPSTSVT